jgi:hypothetical protein
MTIVTHMVRFLVTRGHGYTVKDVRQAAPFRVRVMQYDQLFRARWLWDATYVFSDLDRLSFNDLDIAAELFQQMRCRGLKVWNDPAEVKSRYALLRALHTAGINDFNTYRADELGEMIRYPVFLRKTKDHQYPLTDLLADRTALDQAIQGTVAAGVPREHLMVVEYAAEPVRPGVFRKLSAFRIGSLIVPHNNVHDSHWLVKYGRILGTIEDLYLEERKMLDSNPFADALRKAFDIAHVEYGRADFGIFHGRPQIYEINTNPYVGAPAPHPSAMRAGNVQRAWEMYIRALGRLDQQQRRLVRLADGTVQPKRCRKNRWFRTRPVP